MRSFIIFSYITSSAIIWVHVRSIREPALSLYPSIVWAQGLYQNVHYCDMRWSQWFMYWPCFQYYANVLTHIVFGFHCDWSIFWNPFWVWAYIEVICVSPLPLGNNMFVGCKNLGSFLLDHITGGGGGGGGGGTLHFVFVSIHPFPFPLVV